MLQRARRRIGELGQRQRAELGGVVHENVDAPEALQRGGREALDVGCVGEIGEHRKDFDVERAAFFCDGFEGLSSTGADRKVAPSRAAARASARPRPREAPVIITVVPFRFP